MKKILAMLAFLTLIGCGEGKKQSEASEQSKVVNVYTHRHYEADQNLFEKFEEKYGIKVNVTNASADELIQKMNMEGEHSPADVLITVDAGDRKSTRLNSSHVKISYAVFCLKKIRNQWNNSV